MNKLKTKDILEAITKDKNFEEILVSMIRLAIKPDYCNDGKIDENSIEYKKLYTFLKTPTNWKRESKRRLENYSKFHTIKTWQGIEKDIPDEFEIEIIDGGFVNEQLLNESLKLWVDSKYDKKMLPFVRIFYPDHELSDNYRIEVFTTNDDTKIICWTVVED